MATAQSSKSTNNITLKFTAFSHKFIQIATFFCSSAVSLWPTGFPRWKPGHFCVSTIVKHLVPLTCWHWGRTCVSAHQKHNTPPTHVRRIRNAYHGRTHRSAPTERSQRSAQTMLRCCRKSLPCILESQPLKSDCREGGRSRPLPFPAASRSMKSTN